MYKWLFGTAKEVSISPRGLVQILQPPTLYYFRKFFSIDQVVKQHGKSNFSFTPYDTVYTFFCLQLLGADGWMRAAYEYLCLWFHFPDYFRSPDAKVVIHAHHRNSCDFTEVIFNNPAIMLPTLQSSKVYKINFIAFALECGGQYSESVIIKVHPGLIT